MADRGFIDGRQACATDDGGQRGKLNPSADSITLYFTSVPAIVLDFLSEHMLDEAARRRTGMPPKPLLLHGANR